MVEIKSGVINIEDVVVRKNVLSGVMQYSFGYVQVISSHSDYDAKGWSLGLTNFLFKFLVIIDIFY